MPVSATQGRLQDFKCQLAATCAHANTNVLHGHDLASIYRDTGKLKAGKSLASTKATGYRSLKGSWDLCITGNCLDGCLDLLRHTTTGTSSRFTTAKTAMMDQVRNRSCCDPATRWFRIATCNMPEGKTHALLPVHDPGHWWLLHVDLAHRHITAFDSIRDDENTPHDRHTTATNALTDVLHTATPLHQWTRSMGPDSHPRQRDTMNCGVHALRAITMLTRTSAAPSTVITSLECTKWRQQLLWSLTKASVPDQ